MRSQLKARANSTSKLHWSNFLTLFLMGMLIRVSILIVFLFSTVSAFLDVGSSFKHSLKRNFLQNTIIKDPRDHHFQTVQSNAATRFVPCASVSFSANKKSSDCITPSMQQNSNPLPFKVDWVNPVGRMCVGSALFFMVSAAFAYSPDLAGSPLEKANPQIIVEGAARVVDGDTLVIETSSGQKERVRLLGIDAPESKQLCQDKSGSPYACGLEAKQILEKIVGRDKVACVAAKRDQYSRILGVCFDEKTGTQLNKELVSEGEAVAYVQYSKAYVTQEEAAKQSGRGVWKGKFQRPWEYRKEKRSAGKQVPAAAAVKAPADDDLDQP